MYNKSVIPKNLPSKDPFKEPPILGLGIPLVKRLLIGNTVTSVMLPQSRTLIKTISKLVKLLVAA